MLRVYATAARGGNAHLRLGDSWGQWWQMKEQIKTTIGQCNDRVNEFTLPSFPIHPLTDHSEKKAVMWPALTLRQEFETRS